MKTFSAKANEVDRKWWLIDAKDQVLGRVAVKPGRLDRDATEHLIFGIDQPPFAIHFIGFGGKRLHRRSEKGTEATGRVGDCQPAESGVELVLKVLSRNYNAPQFSSRRHPHFFPHFGWR